MSYKKLILKSTNHYQTFPLLCTFFLLKNIIFFVKLKNLTSFAILTKDPGCRQNPQPPDQ